VRDSEQLELGVHREPARDMQQLIPRDGERRHVGEDGERLGNHVDAVDLGTRSEGVSAAAVKMHSNSFVRQVDSGGREKSYIHRNGVDDVDVRHAAAHVGETVRGERHPAGARDAVTLTAVTAAACSGAERRGNRIFIRHQKPSPMQQRGQGSPKPNSKADTSSGADTNSNAVRGRGLA